MLHDCEFWEKDSCEIDDRESIEHIMYLVENNSQAQDAFSTLFEHLYHKKL